MSLKAELVSWPAGQCCRARCQGNGPQAFPHQGQHEGWAGWTPDQLSIPLLRVLLTARPLDVAASLQVGRRGRLALGARIIIGIISTRGPTVPWNTPLSSETFLESSRKRHRDSEQAHINVRKRVRLLVVLPLTEDLPAGVVSHGAAHWGGQGQCPPEGHLPVTKGRARNTCHAPGHPAGKA